MQLAQLNIAEAIAKMDSPIMADFVNNTDRINAIAEMSEGFIWRLTDDDSNDSYSINGFKSEYIIVNMSVWKDRDSLFKYVYNPGHVEIFKRKKEWFKKMLQMHMVLWYVKDGHEPTIEEGKQRLEYLQKNGESFFAFSFKSNYLPEDL